MLCTYLKYLRYLFEVGSGYLEKWRGPEQWGTAAGRLESLGMEMAAISGAKKQLYPWQSRPGEYAPATLNQRSTLSFPSANNNYASLSLDPYSAFRSATTRPVLTPVSSGGGFHRQRGWPQLWAAPPPIFQLRSACAPVQSAIRSSSATDETCKIL